MVQEAPPAIVADRLTKIYPGKRAIEDVSFEIPKGEIVGFLGPNGAGKTTTMRILTCFQPATSGTARIAGFDVFEQADEVKRNIGYLPESPPIYLDMRVREYLEFVARIKGVPGPERRRRLETTIERCGLGDVQQRVAGKLSKGYRQRVGLAQAILHNPPILILDEPTSGLDPKQVVEVRKLVRELAGEHTIILSTHILVLVENICDRYIIINQGRIAGSGMLGDEATGLQPLYVELHAQHDVSEDLGRVEGVKRLERIGSGEIQSFRLLCERSETMRHRLSSHVVQQGWQLLELRADDTRIEKTYLRAVSSEEGVA